VILSEIFQIKGRWALFSSNQSEMGAIFARIFMEFAQIFRDFSKVFKNFSQISTDFARIFTKSKNVRSCTPATYTTVSPRYGLLTALVLFISVG